MKYLNYQIEDLKTYGGYNTAKEICNQPGLWRKTYLKLVEEQGQILKFLGKVFKNECPDVILAGAGTSAFHWRSFSWRVSEKTESFVQGN